MITMVIEVTCISRLAFTWRSLNLLDCSLLGSRVARFLSSESSPCQMGRSSYSAAAEMISISLERISRIFREGDGGMVRDFLYKGPRY